MSGGRRSRGSAPGTRGVFVRRKPNYRPGLTLLALTIVAGGAAFLLRPPRDAVPASPSPSAAVSASASPTPATSASPSDAAPSPSDAAPSPSASP
jgi:hypothetical protein